jgi:hypothetical protein
MTFSATDYLHLDYLRCNGFSSVLKVNVNSVISTKNEEPTLSSRPERSAVEKSLQKLRQRLNYWLPTGYVEGIPRLADFVSIARNDKVGALFWGNII